MYGLLNSFQKTMLQWNDPQAYNAVHVLRIYEDFEFEKLRRAVNATLEAQGVTGLSLDRRLGTYRYEGGPARCEVKLIKDPEKDPHLALASEIERQLNSTFSYAESFDPFRFFVVPCEDSFFLGICYFHAVADALSIVPLMRDIFSRYGDRGAECCETFDLYPGRFDRLLRHPAPLLRKLASLPSYVRTMNTSCRAPYLDINDSHVGYAQLCLGPEKLHCLSKTAQSWELTVNDLMLALMMKCFSPMCLNRTRESRGKISLGCIVSTRKDLHFEDRHKFGLFLGSFIVSHEVPEGISLMDLARDIRRQTLAIKKGRLYLAVPLELAFGRFMFSLFPREGKKKFYQKYYPLWGGIANINLDCLWKPQPGEKPIDYLRAVSPGPTIPFVLSFTTVREAVNISLTFRSSFFSPRQIEKIKTRFLDTIDGIARQ